MTSQIFKFLDSREKQIFCVYWTVELQNGVTQVSFIYSATWQQGFEVQTLSRLLL